MLPEGGESFPVSSRYWALVYDQHPVLFFVDDLHQCDFQQDQLLLREVAGEHGVLQPAAEPLQFLRGLMKPFRVAYAVCRDKPVSYRLSHRRERRIFVELSQQTARKQAHLDRSLSFRTASRSRLHSQTKPVHAGETVLPNSVPRNRPGQTPYTRGRRRRGDAN